MFQTLTTANRFQRYDMPLSFDTSGLSNAQRRLQIVCNHANDPDSGLFVPTWVIRKVGLNSSGSTETIVTIGTYPVVKPPSAAVPQPDYWYFRVDAISATGTGVVRDTDDVYPYPWYQLATYSTAVIGDCTKTNGATDTTGTFLLSVSLDAGTTILSRIQIVLNAI